MRFRTARIGRLVGPLALPLAVATATTALAAPLDAESCAKLKQQKDALAAAGVQEILRTPPAPGTPALSGERAQQARAFIEIDGQLRFRCGMDLALPTLKPEPVEEFVDAGDTPAPPPPKVKKARPARPATQAVSNGADAKADPAAVATTAPAPAAKAAKAQPKPRPKADDAYRAPPASASAPADQQLPKPQ
jgi:hypothetical protein